MSGKSSAYSNSLLLLEFNNTAIAGVGDTNGLQPSAAAGSLYLALHTADPGVGGNQSTNETAYTNYARVGVARSASGFTVTGNAVNLVANADFPSCGATPGAAITYFSVGTAASGTGKILYSGPISPTITMAQGVIPRITTAANLITES